MDRIIAVELLGIEHAAASAATLTPKVTPMVDDIADGDDFDVRAHRAALEQA